MKLQPRPSPDKVQVKVLGKGYNLKESLWYSYGVRVYKSPFLCSSEFRASFYSLAGVSRKKESLWSSESVVMISLSSLMTSYSSGVFFRGARCGSRKQDKFSGIYRKSMQTVPESQSFFFRDGLRSTSGQTLLSTFFVSGSLEWVLKSLSARIPEIMSKPSEVLISIF